MSSFHLLRSFKPLPVALAALVVCGGAVAQPVTVDASELRSLRDELRQLRQEIDALKARPNAASAASAVVAAPVAPAATAKTTAKTEAGGYGVATAEAPAAESSHGAASASGVSLFGYGEMIMARPRNNPSGSTATVRRGVLGFGYRFNERTRMAAELEIENAVVSKNDNGEAAFEQLYVEHDFNDKVTGRAGLFLIPMGYLNQVHEPTRYYGVNRNLVETAIIPTTWREMGVGLTGKTDGGMKWDAGLVTSFDLNKWDSTSTDGQTSPLAAIHQEGQQARAGSYAMYGALNYNGIPGFNVGGSLFAGGIGQRVAGFAGSDANLALGELHTRWQPGTWDLSALVASGNLTGTAALNASFSGTPVTAPVPNRFDGWYLQAAKRVWKSGDYSLVPFLRYELVNTARGFDGLTAAQTPTPAADTRVWTAGVNFYLHPQVVFKLDMQQYVNNSSRDQINMGVGFHF